MREDKGIGDYHYTKDFGSWAEFVDYAEQPPAWIDGSGSMHADGTDWAGTDTQAEAIHLARYGWPEGRRLMVETMASANVSIPSAHRSEMLDYGGAYPMIPVALAGDPASMVNLGDQTVASKPIVRLMVDAHTPASTDAEEIRAHGAAIISIIDNLEATGYSVEVSIRCAGGDNFVKGYKVYTYCYTVVFKRAGDKLDLDRATFALVHPSTLRRLFFRTIEREPAFSFVNRMRGSRIELDPLPDIIELPPCASGATVEGSLESIGRVLDGHNVRNDWADLAQRARS